MSEQQRERPSLKTFDTYANRNGHDLDIDSPLDVGIPTRPRKDLRSEPNDEAARIASGTCSENASDQTAADTPPEKLRCIGDAGSGTSVGGGKRSDKAGEAVERATAVIGIDEDDAP